MDELVKVCKTKLFHEHVAPIVVGYMRHVSVHQQALKSKPRCKGVPVYCCKHDIWDVLEVGCCDKFLSVFALVAIHTLKMYAAHVALQLTQICCKMSTTERVRAPSPWCGTVVISKP